MSNYEHLMILPQLTKTLDFSKKEDVYVIFYSLSNHSDNVFVQFLFETKKDTVIKFKKLTNKFKTIIKSNSLEFLKVLSDEYEKNGIRLIDFSGTLKHNEQSYIFVRYEPLQEYYEMNHFSTNTTVEALATDILNHNSIQGIQFSKQIIDFFISIPMAYRVLNEKMQIMYSLPISVYYGTQTQYINEVLLFGKEYHKSFDNFLQFTCYEIAKQNSIFSYEFDNVHCVLRLAFKDDDKDIIQSLKRRNLIYKNSCIVLKSDESIKINVKLPLAEMTNIKIYNIDTMKKEIEIRISIADISNMDSSMLLPHYKKIVNKSEAKVIRYVMFLDKFNFSSSAYNNRSFHPFEGDIYYYTKHIEDLFVTSIKNVYNN